MPRFAHECGDFLAVRMLLHDFLDPVFERERIVRGLDPLSRCPDNLHLPRAIFCIAGDDIHAHANHGVEDGID